MTNSCHVNVVPRYANPISDVTANDYGHKLYFSVLFHPLLIEGAIKLVEYYGLDTKLKKTRKKPKHSQAM